MRAFSTFLLLFTLLFFLFPILCLKSPSSAAAPPPSEEIFLPEEVRCGDKILSVPDLLTGRMAVLEIRHYSEEALKATAIALASDLAVDPKKAAEWEFLSWEEAKDLWGDVLFAKYWPRLRQAVEDTWGRVLTKDGLPASASVFPLSWGRTAEEVECPYDFTAEGFETQITRSVEEIEAVFPAFCGTLTVKKARSGRVESVVSGKATWDGKTFAEGLKLPSLCFSATVEGDRVLFRCVGQGDGEGMSLYGANELAKRGADAEEILKTFYPDATLTG